MTQDTIFALSSGAPPSAIAVIRISGPAACSCLAALLRGGGAPPARRASLRRLYSPDGLLLDSGLILFFPGPNTATGEDLVELHVHGGPATVRAIGDALAQLGARPAEAGEFTRRALIAGRMDLTEVEGLAELLSAETEQQRRAALRSAEGGVRRQVEAWTDSALALSAQLEAILDHADEDDVSTDPRLMLRITTLAAEIGATLARPPVERLHDGIRVVLGGPPNAGKSTLLNALVGRSAAIVSDIAGTTRDRIEVPVRRDGVAYLFTDTAGLTESADPIEAIGVGLARDALLDADLVLWLGDAPPPDELANVLPVHAQADRSARGSPVGRIAVSAVTGLGIDALWDAIADRAKAMLPPTDATVLNARQRALAGRAQQALERAALAPDELFAAEELRAALRAFDAITGRAGVEEMLDALFGRFCIGK